jgi:hypothetical protein
MSSAPLLLQKTDMNLFSDNSKIKKLALPFIHYEIITMLAFGWQHH